MPIYEYICNECGHAFEKMTSIANADKTACEKSGKSTQRQLSVFGVSTAGPSLPDCAGGTCDLPECQQGYCPPCGMN